MCVAGVTRARWFGSLRVEQTEGVGEYYDVHADVYIVAESDNGA